MILETLLPSLVGSLVSHFTDSKEVIQAAQENSIMIVAGSALLTGNIADIILRRVPSKKRRSAVLFLADLLVLSEKALDGLKWFSGKLRKFLEWYDSQVEKVVPNNERKSD